VTPDEYRKAINGLLDSQMGVLAMCMGLPDPVRSFVSAPWADMPIMSASIVIAGPFSMRRG